MFSSKLFRVAILVAVAVMFVSVVAMADSSLPPQKMLLLDKMTFDGKIANSVKPLTPVEPIKPTAETITFLNGMLTSAYFEPQGYKACAYKASISGDKIIFSAIAKHVTEPLTIEWKGSVQGQNSTSGTTLNATVKMTKSGTIVNQYSVSALERLAATPSQQ